MNNIMPFLSNPASQALTQWGLCIIRIGIGALMVGHGFPKIIGGVSKWEWLGQTMGNLGIHFWPVLWGFMAACTEFFGGFSLILGLGTRIACIPLTFTMIVAFIMHLANNDSFSVYSHALTLIVIFIGLFVIGSGTHSLDYLIFSSSNL